jgi:hypothetical protein
MKLFLSTDNNGAAFAVLCSALFAAGCAGATGAEAIATGDPVAKGLGCIAAAIVTHGVLQILFRD